MFGRSCCPLGAALTGRPVDPHVAIGARGGLREPAAVGRILPPNGGPGHGAGGIPERLRLDGTPSGIDGCRRAPTYLHAKSLAGMTILEDISAVAGRETGFQRVFFS